MLAYRLPRRTRVVSLPSAPRRLRHEPDSPSPVTAEMAKTSRPSSRASRSRTSPAAGQLRLAHRDELRPLRQFRVVQLQFAADRAVIWQRIGAVVGNGSTRWMSMRVRSTWRRNSCPRPTPACAPSIRPGMSASTKRVRRPTVDHAEVRVLGRERIIGDLRRGPRQPAEQRRLARIRQADQADVGDHLQFEDDPAFLARLAGLAFAGRAVGRGGERLVAVAALAALGDDRPRRRPRSGL